MARLGEICKVVSRSTPKSGVTWIKLEEVCSITMGQSPDSSSYNNEARGIPFFQGNADFGKRNPTVRVWCNAPTKVAHADDLLISVRAPIGALNFADTDCCIGRGLAAITTDESQITKEYLWYVLASKIDELNSKGTGSTFKAINRKSLAEMELSCPPLSEQRVIANRLDKVVQLQELRKQQLKKLDELVKARFVELFGDVSTFKTEPLKQNVEEMFIGPFGSSLKNEFFVSKENAYCMVYEQKHAIKGTMDVETRYIDFSKYQELKRFTVTADDIIVSCRGTIGRTFIVPENAPLGVMHPSIMKLRLKKDTYNTIFFKHLLTSVLEEHEKSANGSGVKMAVTASTLGKELFIVPPLDLQNCFASFVEQTNKTKTTIQKSLVELQTLFDSLMQEYFG